MSTAASSAQPLFQEFPLLPAELRQHIWKLAVCAEAGSRVIRLHRINENRDVRIVPTKSLVSQLLQVNSESRNCALNIYSSKYAVYKVPVPLGDVFSRDAYTQARELSLREDSGEDITNSIPTGLSETEIGNTGGFSTYESYTCSCAFMDAAQAICQMQENKSEGLIRVSPEHALFVADLTCSEFDTFFVHQKTESGTTTGTPIVNVTTTIPKEVIRKVLLVEFGDHNTTPIKRLKQEWDDWLRQMLPGMQGLWFTQFPDQKASFSAEMELPWAGGLEGWEGNRSVE